MILADVNVTGAGTDLNIAPGTVVKYGVGRSLIARDGGRVLANGTVDKNIIFTSCRDQNSYVGSTNANTATISGCSGGPAPSEYNTAIYVLGNAGMTKADSFSYLKIFDAKYGIRLDQNIGSIHDSNFSFFKSLGLAYSGVFLGIETDVNIYGNAFSWFQTDAKGIYVTLDKTFAGAIYQNSFSNFQSAHAIYLEQSSTGPIYSNRFDSFSNTTGTTATGIYLGLETTGNIYQNIFSNFNGATGISKWLGAVNATIYNNLFYNFTASGVGIQSNWQDFGGNILNNTFSNLQTSTAFVAYDPSTTRIQRNLFSNVSTAISGTITGAISNNAYYSVGTIGKPGPNDQNSATGFTTTPFIADNTDRNFLLNTTSTGGAMLVDAGGVDSNGVDINNFFNLKTTQLNNKLDTGTIDIGYHFDQNGPYVQVLSPNDFNTLTGVQTIDFNVESEVETGPRLCPSY
ncbi:MAG: hypothetical protein J4215_00010 [Candidatus Diapherotrites archaeon]|uniref:Right-handed parallel beta-helix repeat-containing protein n=1 Tax=Candidatus Iainarchaeum sp. TaxID=3101447 RepID=A0A8T4L0U3_9ARCH|nr:hypothetical protein [Candidatus Diapherotrites archaeon]